MTHVINCANHLRILDLKQQQAIEKQQQDVERAERYVGKELEKEEIAAEKE